MMKAITVTALAGIVAAAPAPVLAQEPQMRPASRSGATHPEAAERVLHSGRDRPLPNRAVRAGDIEAQVIYSLRGEELGTVKRIVLNATDGRTFIVLEHGGLAGWGEREFPLPVERVHLQDGRLVAPGLTGSALDAARDWDVNNYKYRELADSEIVNIAQR